MTSAKICFVLFALGVCLHQISYAFVIKDCTRAGKSDAELISLEVDSCPDQSVDRCAFTKGQNATMHIKFKPSKIFSKANVKIWGKLGPIYIKFPLDGPDDACGNYGFECPVQVGKQEALKLSIPVLRSYPSVNCAVRFEMKDENKNMIVCVEFPVEVKSA